MKKSILLLIILGFFNKSYSQNEIEKNILKLKTNIVYVKDLNLAVQQFEVSIGDWLTFVESKRKAYLKENNIELLDDNGIEQMNKYFDFLYTGGDVLNNVRWQNAVKYYRKYYYDFSTLSDFYNEDENTIDNEELYAFNYTILEEIQYSYYREVTIPFHVEIYDFVDDEENFDKKARKDMQNTLFSYLDFPIYSIPFEMALEYANWSAEVITHHSSNTSKYKFKGRLMTEEEYDELLRIGGPRLPENKSIYPDTLNKEGCIMMNVRYNLTCKSTEEKIKLYGDYQNSVPIWSYNPDKYGIYNLFGNMAEMTMTKRRCKRRKFYSLC
jgi:formylglycine-generating enzyme required for sulfatase activity